jgi:2'-hydroxyisoflavone reductase
MRSLVIGGTLFIGRALVSKLLARGHQVTVLHRRPAHDLGPDVRGLQADRNDAAAVASAVQGQEFDYVFDNVYDWERGTTGEQVAATARIFAESSKQLRRYVFVSSVAAYGRGLEAEALREDHDLAPDDHPDIYSRNKAMSERALLRMHRQAGFPAVTLRVPFVYGANNPFYRETWFWERLRDGRPILLPERGEREMQFVHVDDLAEIQVLCAETDAASGQAFNSAEPAAYTQRQFVEILAAAAGNHAPAIVPVLREKLIAAGGQVMQPPYYFAERLDLPPLPQDCRKMQQLLGFTPRPLAQGMTETYAWWRQQSPVVIDYSWEDRLLLEVANQFVQGR